MTTTKVKTFLKGKDKGFIGKGINWWFNPNFKDSFSIFDLDSFYQNDYFSYKPADPKTIKNNVNTILKYGKVFLGKDVKSVLEIGSGGGWFTKEFIKNNIEVTAVEGSSIGFKKTKQVIGGSKNSIAIKHDLRLTLNLNKKFDIVVCTEVAEHIEPPFSGQLVQNLTNYSKLVWFSFEKPMTNEQHYHHPNEQPEKFWRKLFEFYDFKMVRLSDEISKKLAYRGGYIFYHKSLKVPEDFKQSKNSDHKLKNYPPGLKSYLGFFLKKMSEKINYLANKILYS